MTTIILEEPGSGTYIIPADVYRIDVRCFGRNGCQSVQALEVIPGMEVPVYVEHQDDTEACTYFGPYLSAYDTEPEVYIPKIEITLL